MTKKRASAKKEKPKAATEPKPAPAASAAPREPSEARNRASDERLAMRIAVLEDVVKRNAQDLGRRLADVERRVTPS